MFRESPSAGSLGRATLLVVLTTTTILMGFSCLAGELTGVPLDRQSANISAFARLYGLIRWFHPSDQAAAADWNRLALSGIPRLRYAASPQELAEQLERIFLAVAPSLRVFPAERPDPTPDTLAAPGDASCVGILIWEHEGVETEYSPLLGDIYHSTRRWLSGPEVASGLYDPEHPLYAELGGGVAAWVATTVYGDSTGTYPRTAGGVTTPTADADETEVLLADAVVVWNVMAHFYPYFDVVEKNWGELLDTVIRKIIEKAEDYSYNEMRADLCIPLRDGHAGLYNPPGSGYAQAIPDIAQTLIEGDVIVSAAEGEARKADLAPGDRILRIDGVAVDDVLARWMSTISGSQQKRLSLSTIRLLLDKKDTRVSLELERTDGTAYSVSLARTRSVPLDTRTLEPIQEIEPGILYVDISRASREMLEPLATELDGYRGILVDGRGYPRDNEWASTFTNQRLDSIPLLIPITHLPYQADLTYRTATSKTRPRRQKELDAALVFLIDANAFSAGEHQLSYFVNAGIGTFVGTTTAGTNGNYNRLALPSGGGVAWTGMRLEWPDGSRFHTVGIQPDIWVEPTREGIADGRDEQLEMALMTLREKVEAAREP